MRIAVAGGGGLASCVLEPLLESSHEIVALVRDGRKTKGMRRKLEKLAAGALERGSSAISLARRGRIPIVYIDRMDSQELAPLAACKPDLLLVAGFGIILKQPLLTLPRIGCVNCHSSLLPRHRGPNPYRAVILADEPETGVTFHVMTEGIDDGDILGQYRFSLAPEDTGGSVFMKCNSLARRNVLDVIERIEREGLRGAPQDPAEATYDKNLSEEEMLIDWSWPARRIEALIRACCPFSPARFRHGRHIVHVWSACYDEEPCDAPPGTVLAAESHVFIATGEGALQIRQAALQGALNWTWPSPLHKLKPGDRLGP